jgi:hypothetical protein
VASSRVEARNAFLDRLRGAVVSWPSAINPQELLMLERHAAMLPEAERFDVLTRAFVNPKYGGFVAQQYSGSLLLRLQPPCTRPVVEVLSELLPNWNRSIEELPKYLERTFGRGALLSALDELDRQDVVDAAVLQTVRFWLRSATTGEADPG